MKVSIFLLLFLIITSRVFCQFKYKTDPQLSKKVDFIGDTIQKNIIAKNDYDLDSIFKLNKKYDFEFRLWEKGLTNNETNVFIIMLQNNQWFAKYFQWNKNWQKDGKKLIETTVDQSKLDRLWALLVSNDVLTLPTENVLNDKMVRYVIDTVHLRSDNHFQKVTMVDGILYNFELLTPQKKRFYDYGCPQILLKEYGNIKELYNVSVIILLIKRYLGIPYVGC